MCCLLAAVGLITLALPGLAEGHYIDSHGRWTFGGAHLNRNTLSATRTLPMNIIFYPKAYLTSEGRFDRIKRHLEQHLRLNVTDDRGLDFGSGFSKGCGDDNRRFLDLPSNHAPPVQNDNNYVIWPSGQNGSPDRCHNRYHARLWYDDDHPAGSHSEEAHRWIVAQLHHELWGDYGDAGTTHYFDQPFDDVEFHMVQMMRQVREPHTDPRGLYPNNGHCADFNWKKLPGSHGWFGGKRALPPNHNGRGYFSNGSITRIGLDHCPR